MLRDGEVVIVSGPPGAGKSTVAAGLASAVALGVHLESDFFYRSIAAGFVPPHLPESHQQNIAILDLATDAAASYAEAGFVVVWDGVVGPWFIDRVAARLSARGVPLRYLVLRADREMTLDRVRQRDGSVDASGAEVMADQFADLGQFESHVVAGDGTAAEVLRRCQAALRGGALAIRSDAWIDDRWSVSVKGVLGWDDEVVVLRNARNEWELPGGRLDATDASPEAALRREMQEELGIDVEVGALLDTWIYDVDGKRVLILTFACSAERPTKFELSDEHDEVSQLTLETLRHESIPNGYLRSIGHASALA